MQCKDYKIISENVLRDLEIEVIKKIQDGWQPAGPLIVANMSTIAGKSYTQYFKEMIRCGSMGQTVLMETQDGQNNS